MRIFAGAIALVLLVAGCGGSSSPSSARSFGFQGCVPGQPVGKIRGGGEPTCATLEDSAANTSGDFDCKTKAGHRHYYVVNYAAMTVYGSTGGTWRRAPAGTGNVALIKQLGCRL